CQNNLKQWGIIMKMYAGEARDYFPSAGRGYIPGPFHPGIDGKTLYGDYWTDLNLAQCPSDSKDWDFDVRLEQARAGLPNANAQACLDGLLTSFPSYLYIPYAAKTASQAKDAFVRLLFNKAANVSGPPIAE